MADDEGSQQELRLPHIEAPGFKTVFANGVIFTSPSDASKSWILTFYSEGARIVSETLLRAESEDAWRHATPPRIETERIRRDEVCVIIPEAQLAALINVISAAMKGER